MFLEFGYIRVFVKPTHHKIFVLQVPKIIVKNTTAYQCMSIFIFRKKYKINKREEIAVDKFNKDIFILKRKKQMKKKVNLVILVIN